MVRKISYRSVVKCSSAYREFDCIILRYNGDGLAVLNLPVKKISTVNILSRIQISV